MRLTAALTVCCLLSLAAASPQGGFFSGVRNLVNRFNPFRQQSNSRPAQQTFSRPAAPTFSRPSPSSSFSRPSSSSSFSSSSSSSSSSQPSPFSSFSQPSSSSSSSFSSSSSSSSPSQPSSSSFSQPSSSSSFSRPPPSSPQTSAPQRPQSLPATTGGRGNHVWQGRDYILTWLEGRNSFSWSGAKSYCQSRGMRMVSLDSTAKRDHFMQQVASDGSPYFWAGGRLSSDKRTLTWENGRREGIRKGSHPWSFTGSRGSQPDGSGSEHCLAILNNFYNDGVKFHDVGCSHRKPTVCEA